jgi:hypothetical protein
MHDVPGTTTIPAALRSRLRAQVDQRGIVGASQALHFGRSTLANLLAGLPVRRGTIALLVRELDRLEGAEPTAPHVDDGGEAA